MNGKRPELKRKRHYIHQGKEPFWEGFETFLIETYNYDPTVHYLVINGDGARWITACREYFKNAFFVLDWFHVARDLRIIFKDHPRWRAVRVKLAKYDVKGLLTEMHSTVGTLHDEQKEAFLEGIIEQYFQYPQALGDYQNGLQSEGIDTKHMRPMGASESRMRVFAERLKNGRSWSDKGIAAFIRFMIGLKDGIDIKTLISTMTNKLDEVVETLIRQSIIKSA